MKVTIKEIVEALRGECTGYQRVMLADLIEARGTEQPSIDALIAEIDGVLLSGNSSDELFCITDIKPILDKYRGQK